MYRVSTILKHAEKDNYKEGCDPSTSQLMDFELNIKRPTLDALFKELKIYLGEYFQIDPCGDAADRVDFTRTENERGEEPTESELEQWKKGNLDLWLVDYTCYIEKTEPCNIEKEARRK
jgi:hypothetical protein